MLLLAALSFGVGVVLHIDDATIRQWFLPRGWGSGYTLTAHDLAAYVVVAAPFVLAAVAANLSRMPGAGFFVAVLGLIPMFLFADFDSSNDWTLAIALAGIAVADLLLFYLRRGFVSGLLTGIVGGIAYAGSVATSFQQDQALDTVVNEQVLLLELLVVPAVAVLLAAVIGGTIGGTRREG